MKEQLETDEELPDLTSHMTKKEKEKWFKRINRDLDHFNN